MGWDPRPATTDELKAMERTTREWLEAGACCLCLGLDYQPSANADLHELGVSLKDRGKLRRNLRCTYPVPHSRQKKGVGGDD